MAVLEIKDVSIQFPGVKALDTVSVVFPEGKATALCGENGAGKSTLGKIIAGVNNYPLYTGKIILDGKEVQYHNTRDAEKDGITIIHQELNLINDQTVKENVCLSHLPNKYGVLNFEEMSRITQSYIDELSVDISPESYIRDLSTGKRQLVEIIKALSKNPRFIIFDEATSSLSEKEIEVLFGVIDRLKKKNITIIFVTHKLDEIFRCCDEVVVLKDGKFVWQKHVENTTKHDIVTGMIGRELSEMYPPKAQRPRGKELLRVEGWTAYDKIYPDKKAADNISFALHEGEILGIYGLVGAGRTELLQSIFEGRDAKSKGTLYLHGKKTIVKDPADAVEKNIAFITEDRRKTGLILISSVRRNIAVASLKKRAKGGMVDFKAESAAVDIAITRFKIKVPNSDHLVSKLSGGNQQKVVVGKWTLTEPDILIMDEPTRGIDVGTKAEIYKMLREFTEEGKGVIVISDELPEVLGVSDHILVMFEGSVVGEFTAAEANETVLAEHALGVKRTQMN